MQDLPTTLVTVSAAALLLYSLLSLVQVFRRQNQTGCLSILLMTTVVISYLSYLIVAATSDEPLSSLATTIAYAVLGSLITIGVVLWLLERRGEQGAPNLYSRGILSASTGLLMAAAFVFVPVIPNSIFIQPTTTPIAESILSSGGNNNADSSNIVPTSVALEITSTPEVTTAPTMTRTPLPSPSPTRTLRAYVPPTVTPTPESLQVDDLCGGVVTTNLNVRAEDDTDSEIVTIIPEGRRVALIAKNTDATWWQVDFDGNSGWISGEFVDLDPVCLADTAR